jgi:hypothetical protein
VFLSELLAMKKDLFFFNNVFGAAAKQQRLLLE